MHFELIDWSIVIAFLAISLFIGLKFKNEANKSLTDFFLGGRKLPWYIAGISMVATTFAADTPLAVTELVAKNGISSNWLWWNMLIGGMLTTFFFAKLWRKANVITELEFIELRYSGKPAAILRGFRAIYLGLFMNVLVIGWVNIAMISILQVFFDLDWNTSFLYTIGIMIIALIYSSLSGLLGVAITDVVQFFIAMTGCIILAVIVVNSDKIGGISGLKEKLPKNSLNFFPSLGTSNNGSTFANLSISIGAFLSFSLVQWWASWYPGAEPGGGGYIAQRMMSAKNEKHAVLATLFFQVAHYCLRPWPWILVGLCSIVLYPDLAVADKKLGFVMAMKEFLPNGLLGLLFVAFLAAYMSTISTQLNWGASFLTNDLYKRFFKAESNFETPEKAQKHYLLVAKWSTLIIMIVACLVTTKITSISAVWEFIIECGAGLGMVLILRWYWWRINAWSEISATIAPFIIYGINRLFIIPLLPQWAIDNRVSYFITVLGTTVCWLLVTYLSKQTDKETLHKFYDRVEPAGNWEIINFENKIKKESHLLPLVSSWLSSVIFTYSLLFSTGKLILQEWNDFSIWISIALFSGIIFKISLSKSKIFD